MVGKCALCQQEKELQLSHIIPKFVGNYLKSTAVGNIRNQEAPNRVIQDIEKHELLCHDCEELFSAAERYFANTIFYPYLRDKLTEFSYSDQLFYFITSLSWRSLYLDIINFVRGDDIRIDVLERMIEAEGKMRRYLLHESSDIGSIENHIFFYDVVTRVSNSNDSLKEPNLLVHRALHSYSGYSENTIYTISNLMGIIIVTLYSKDSDEEWLNTQIWNSSGIIKAEKQNIRSRLGGEFQYWEESLEKSREKMTNATKEKIEKTIADIGEDIVQYAIYQDIVDDAKIIRE